MTTPEDQHLPDGAASPIPGLPALPDDDQFPATQELTSSPQAVDDQDAAALPIPMSTADAFAALDHAHQLLVASEVAELVAITHAADLYQIDAEVLFDGAERWIRGGHDGTPMIGEFLSLEIGGLLGISPGAAAGRIAGALDLRHRLPRLWNTVIAGRARVWQALKIVEHTAYLTADAAAIVDRQVAQWLPGRGFSRVMGDLPGWISAADPAAARERAERSAADRRVWLSKICDGNVTLVGVLRPSDGIHFNDVLTRIADALPPQHPDAGRDLEVRRAAAFGVLARQACGQDILPTSTLIVHLNASDPALTSGQGAGSDNEVRVGPNCPPVGVATIAGWGHLLTEQLPEFLAGSKVIVRPIIDPVTMAPVDGYQFPDRMRFVVEQRNPIDAFPYGTRPARSCDIDHTVPYVPGEPGQTGLDNAAPLSRFTHRGKTHARWRLEQPTPGCYQWTSPFGYRYLVTADGTTRIHTP